MMIAIDTVLSNFIGSATKPGAMTKRTISGIDSSIRIVRPSSTVKRTPNTSSEKRRAPSSPLASISLANKGTKAELNAPSAKSRRNVLGKRKAALKASATGPVPKAEAISISRVKPKTRLINVPDATVANFLTKLIRDLHIYSAVMRMFCRCGWAVVMSPSPKSASSFLRIRFWRVVLVIW